MGSLEETLRAAGAAEQAAPVIDREAEAAFLRDYFALCQRHRLYVWATDLRTGGAIIAPFRKWFIPTFVKFPRAVIHAMRGKDGLV